MWENSYVNSIMGCDKCYGRLLYSMFRGTERRAVLKSVMEGGGNSLLPQVVTRTLWVILETNILVEAAMCMKDTET